jgi:hypothetical protein
MVNSDIPEVIAQTRMVNAAAVLENRVDLRGYPYRYLTVTAGGVGPANKITSAVAAAEILDRFGWDLVTISESDRGNTIFAIVRRR